MLLIVLVVLFTMAMALWAFGLFGGSPEAARNLGVLAWVACLILGVVVFLSGFGVLVWRAGP